MTDPPVPARRPSWFAARRWNRVGWGLLLGVVVAAVASAALLLMASEQERTQLSNSTVAEQIGGWLGIVTAVAGLASAVVLIVRSSTRRLGIGMLIGMLMLTPVQLFALYWYAYFSTPGG